MDNELEREKRKKAADYARASISLEGFKLSQEAEERIKRFIEGDMDLQELIGK